MEHGLDERYAKLLFPRSRPSQIRTQQTNLLAALRLHGKLLASLLPRRSCPRQKLVATQNARRSVAAIRQPPSALRLSISAPGQEPPIHGPGTRPPPRMERSPQSRLPLASAPF